MYSVIRFLDKAKPGILDEVTRRLQLDAGLTAERDKGVANRVSCSISTEPTWPQQRTAILLWMSRVGNTLVFCHDAEVMVELDIAIEPEDYNARVLTELILDCEFLRLLVERALSLTFSIYGHS